MLKFKREIEVKTGIIPKKDFQSLLSQFRRANGYTVEKLNAGYQVYFINRHKEKQVVLIAMNGNNGYLMRHDVDCLTLA